MAAAGARAARRGARRSGPCRSRRRPARRLGRSAQNLPSTSSLDSGPDSRVYDLVNLPEPPGYRTKESITMTAKIPIACNMTSAPDTAAERLAEYRELFGAWL